VIREAAESVAGVAAMLGFREGWRGFFDVSERGLWRSFWAAVIGAPAFLAVVAIQGRLAVALADNLADVQRAGIAYFLTLYVALWAHFPIAARVFTGLFGLERSWGPWVVVHNWTVLTLLIVQLVLGLPLLLGLTSPEATRWVFQAFIVFSLYAHVRAAMGALQAPLSLAIGGACLMVIVWLFLQIGIYLLFLG